MQSNKNNILIKSKFLRSGMRNLKVEVLASLFISDLDGDLGSLGCDLTELNITSDYQSLKSLFKNAYSESTFDNVIKKEILSILEGSKSMLKPKEREVDADDKTSRGAVLNNIESMIKTFDIEQKQATSFVVDGAQRIRGLAGSGKTIVLAMKAAQLHLQDPSANILYTF